MPQLSIVRLPNDHTSGTKVGKPTPTAMVAENDLALGRVVEAITKSKFWKETAIFVVEDDAQNGSDHVDAHRTVALVISPYTQPGTCRSHHVFDGQHFAQHGVDPRPQADEPIRRRRPADVQCLSKQAYPGSYTHVIPETDLKAQPR